LSRLLVFDPCQDKQLLQGWTVLWCVLLCGKEGAQQLLDQGASYTAALDKAGALRILNPHRRGVGMLSAELPVDPTACKDGDGVCSAGDDAVGMRCQLGSGGGSSSGGGGSSGGNHCGSDSGGDCVTAPALGGVAVKGGAVKAIASSDSVCTDSSSADGFCEDAVAVIAEGAQTSKPC
jgi:hypothetical protein